MIAGTLGMSIDAARRASLLAVMVLAATAASLVATESASAVVLNDHKPNCRSVSTSPATAQLMAGVDQTAVRNLVPVWAMVEGGKPVVGGRVQLYSGSGAHRQLLALPDAKRSTDNQGAVVLHPRRIPDDLTVVVRGGTVAGRPFLGSLKTRVSGYHSRDILTVNPVTTIVTAYRQAHPSLSYRKSVQRVKRYLRIPGFHDIAIDLRRSDMYFDGDVLLGRLGEGRMDDLVTKVVRRMDRVGRRGSDPFVSVDPKVALRKAERASLGDAEETGGAYIAKSLLSGVLGAAGGQAENAALGFVLSAFGLSGGGGDAAALAAIQSQLNQISSQLTDLEAGVSVIESELSSDELKTLIGQADSDQSLVDGAENCLSFVMALKPGDPDLKTLSAGLVDYIGKDLLTVGDDLHSRISGSQGLVQASYEATFAAARVQTNPSYPFWTQADSDQPRKLLDYYAGYQAQLAMLTAEYDHAQGLQASTVVANVQSFSDDVNDEISELKPGVPDGTVVDTNTDMLWNQEPGLQCESDYPGEVFLWSPEVNGVPVSKEFPCGASASLNTFSFFDVGPQSGRDPNGSTVQLDHYEPPFSLGYEGTSSPFDLQTARLPDITDLYKDWTMPGGGSSPADFLARHGGFDMKQPIVWVDEDKGTGPACQKNTGIGDICIGLDLSAPPDKHIAFLDYAPDEPQAAILWNAKTPAETFWFGG